jgi:hypothetical protein
MNVGAITINFCQNRIRNQASIVPTIMWIICSQYYVLNGMFEQSLGTFNKLMMKHKVSKATIVIVFLISEELDVGLLVRLR